MRTAYWRLLAVVVAALAAAGVVIAGSTLMKAGGSRVVEAVTSANDVSPSTWYDKTYGTFTPTTVTGSGDQLVSLPAPGGIATFTTASPHYEVLNVLTVDGKYEEGDDLYDDVYGPVTQGEPAAWNVNSPQLRTPKLEVKATGAWKLVLTPMSSAPELPTSGTGSGVFRYNGAAGTWKSTFAGPASDPNFGVCQSNITLPLNYCLGADSSPNTLPHRAGPSIVVVQSNGRWTLK